MLMFRFWGSDSRGSEKIVDTTPSSATFHSDSLQPHTLCDALPSQPSDLRSPKRRRQTPDGEDDLYDAIASSKRLRLDLDLTEHVLSPPETNHSPDPVAKDFDLARDEIRHQFGVEILLKHNELRLIDQELAKCQIALEQLRRCHLIPYPVSRPTPEQMLSISAGKGPALQPRNGEHLPKWAPPFGVVDGPYARHYSKWLIPDPSFDGIQPEWHSAADTYRARSSCMEGRTTRNSFVEGVSVKGRSARGASQKHLQALPSGYPQQKDKNGPCVLKRTSDGETVKLVCLDCHRENFSSTQGFINHCRIAHKRDFKSHEEAAVHCGQPIDASENKAALPEDKPVAQATQVAQLAQDSGLVHPFARPEMTEQQAYIALRSRLAASMELFRQGKLPAVSGASAGSSHKATRSNGSNESNFHASGDVPYLSRLMKSRKFNGNLESLVTDAKTRVSMEDITPGEESEDLEPTYPSFTAARDIPPARTPGVMRMPAKSSKSPVPQGPAARPTSSKGRAAHMSIVSPPSSNTLLPQKTSKSIMSDEDIDMEDANLSPHTLISNNAPSLVSDDGEYDDSDEGSSVSGASDNLDADSVSDVAEITLDDEHDTRSLRRGSSSVSGTVALRKEDPKHVTFISPVKGSGKDRHTHKV